MKAAKPSKLTRFNEEDFQTVIHALRVAASRFRDDAATAREQTGPQWEWVADQFEDQANQTDAIADQIEVKGILYI